MSSVPNVSINQFSQAPVPGQVDLQITNARVITGKLGTVSGSLKAGAAVKLDSSLTAGFNPQFVAAADAEDAMGILIRTVKKATFVTGDQVQVAYFGGPVVWQVAGATLSPGQQLEFVTTSGQAFAQPLAAGALRGIALDPAVDSALFRMITLSGLVVPA